MRKSLYLYPFCLLFTFLALGNEIHVTDPTKFAEVDPMACRRMFGLLSGKNKLHGFLESIHENPDDDSLRLIFADWLAETGDTARAEFIQVQVELGSIQDTLAPRSLDESVRFLQIFADKSKLRSLLSRRKKLLAREKELLDKHGFEWLHRSLALDEGQYIFSRGFVEEVNLYGLHTIDIELAKRRLENIVGHFPTLKFVYYRRVDSKQVVEENRGANPYFEELRQYAGIRFNKKVLESRTSSSPPVQPGEAIKGRMGISINYDFLARKHSKNYVFTFKRKRHYTSDFRRVLVFGVFHKNGTLKRLYYSRSGQSSVSIPRRHMESGEYATLVGAMDPQ